MSKRALIFDDNPVNTKMLTTFLEQAGYGVDLALNFEELRVKHTQGYSFVLIDVHSPAIDKYAFQDFVMRSKSYPCPPLIAILNSNRDKEIKEYINMGMDGYLTKPISVKSLRDMIERIDAGHAIPTPGDDVIDVEKMASILNLPEKSAAIRLYDQFFISAEKEIMKMYEAVTVKDYNVLKELARKFKSAAKNLRMPNLGKLAEDMEMQTKYPSATLDLGKVVHNLESGCQRVYSAYYMKYHKKNAEK